MRPFTPARAAVGALLFGALLAGCADPASTVAPSTPALDVGGGGGGRLFVFTSPTGVPADFAAAVAALGGSVEASIPGIGVAAVSGVSDEALAQLAQRTDVSLVGVDQVLTVDPPAAEPEAVDAAAAEATPAASAEAVPLSAAEPHKAVAFARQWNLRAIGANKAWAAGRLGVRGVTVAIVDGGIDYLHPDLRGKVDLARSVSFVPSEDAIVRQLFPTRHAVTDLHFHGTFVASIVSSNATFFAGVTSGVTLMGVKVIGVSGQTPTSLILQGIVFAADNGADVINVSLGSRYLRNDARGALAATIRAVNYAHRKGATVVVAPGNDAVDMDHNGAEFMEFCNAPNVICVSATGPTAGSTINGPWTDVDAPAPYSNYGRSAIDVAAPGGGGLPPAPVPPVALNVLISGPCSQTSLVIPTCRGGIFALRLNGTSFAAPHVSALAALLVETLGRNPGAIRDAIMASSDDLGEAGTDPYYGKGRINVARALGLP